MVTDDLLRSSAAVRGRAERGSTLSSQASRQEILSLVEQAANRLDGDIWWQSDLCVVRSLVALGKPLDALTAFEHAVRKCGRSRPVVVSDTESIDLASDAAGSMNVEATIVSHQLNDVPSSVEFHQFVFELRDIAHGRIQNTISLQTACMLAGELAPTSAFARMVRTIAATEEDRFDALAGRIFAHA